MLRAVDGCLRTTHLVCRDIESCRHTEKFRIAVQNNIPVVPLSWVAACVQAQKILDVQSALSARDIQDDKPRKKPASTPLDSDSPERLRAAQAQNIGFCPLLLGEQGELLSWFCVLLSIVPRSKH